MNYNQSAGERIRGLMKMQPELSRLISVNLVIWFALSLVQLAGFLSQPPGIAGDQIWLYQVLQWLGVPAALPALFAKPWTIVTYMFVQEDFWHLFFNMIWLFWFGKIFMEFLPGRKIYLVYCIGGISGALTFILAYNIFPVFAASLPLATTIGASASVLGITIATAVLVPDYSINLMLIGPLKIKYIALFTVILDVLMIRSGNAGGHFAHIGGAISGALYVLAMRNNLNDLLGFSKLKFFKIYPFSYRRVKRVYTTGKPLSDEEYNKAKAMKQAKIDKILDKISRSGYSSLSSDEKDFLFNNSKKD